jgi:hypothetical protein
MAGRKKLPDGEKRVSIRVFVKKKHRKQATKKLKAIARKYNTA